MLRRRRRRSLSDINTIKGRDGRGPPAADLLVCFPHRAHLSLMPKATCSPARPPDPATRHHHRHRLPLRKSGNRGRGGGSGHLSWAKTMTHNSDMSEPTSPKVTCSGQIKVKAKPRSCKNWQSVMEEIERIHKHKNRKQKKRWARVEAVGFKKDVLQFLTCLRNIRFDIRCFGSFPSAEILSDDEDDYEEDEEYIRKGDSEESSHKPKADFSKWFMILRENQGEGSVTQEESRGKTITPCLVDGDDDASSAPPTNALLLMRCRSAPAKGWLEKKDKEEEEAGVSDAEMWRRILPKVC